MTSVFRLNNVLLAAMFAFSLAACGGEEEPAAPAKEPPDIGVDLRCSPTQEMEDACEAFWGSSKDGFTPFDRCLRDSCDVRQIRLACMLDPDLTVALSNAQVNCVDERFTKVAALRDCEDRYGISLDDFPPPPTDMINAVVKCYNDAIKAQESKK